MTFAEYRRRLVCWDSLVSLIVLAFVVTLCTMWNRSTVFTIAAAAITDTVRYIAWEAFKVWRAQR